MQVSIRYYRPIKEETAIEKEGHVLIDSGLIPVTVNVRKYSRDKEDHIIAYFSPKNNWTVRLHLEPEEIDLLIRKLQEAKDR